MIFDWFKQRYLDLLFADHQEGHPGRSTPVVTCPWCEPAEPDAEFKRHLEEVMAENDEALRQLGPEEDAEARAVLKTSAEWMDLLFPDMELVDYTGFRGVVWWGTRVTMDEFLDRLAQCKTRSKTGPGSYTGWLDDLRGGRMWRMTRESEAQAIHDAQRAADPDHDQGGCWCCCIDCCCDGWDCPNGLPLGYCGDDPDCVYCGTSAKRPLDPG